MAWHTVYILGSGVAADETLRTLANKYASAFQAEIKAKGKPADAPVYIQKVPEGRIVHFSPAAFAIGSTAGIFDDLRVTESQEPPDLGGLTNINA